MESENAEAVCCPYSNTIQCLGICEMTGNSNECYEIHQEKFQPDMSERNLPSAYPLPPLTESLPTEDKTERFKFATEESLAEFAEGVVPLSTSRNFREWMEQRNSRYLIF